jgi:hypothetical protein
MTASGEVARHAEAPGPVISRGPGEPRPARRKRAAILSAAVATVTAGPRDAFLSPAAHGSPSSSPHLRPVPG